MATEHSDAAMGQHSDHHEPNEPHPDLPMLSWSGHRVWGDFQSLEAVRKAVAASGQEVPRG